METTTLLQQHCVPSARRPLEFQFLVRKSDQIRRMSDFFLLHGISVKPDKKKKGTSGGINVLARKDDSVVR
jgi:hypothetical protein